MLEQEIKSLLSDSFTALLSTSDHDIDAFVKSTHSANSARTAQRILIPPAAIITLKAIRFELEDRERCGALPQLATLQALTAVQINYMRIQKTKSAQDQVLFSAISKLPAVVVPKLTASNYEHHRRQ